MKTEERLGTVERESICAFIDILGFSDVISNGPVDKRKKLIELLYLFNESAADLSPNVQNLGIGVHMAPSCQVTTFSDCIALSVPFDSPKVRMTVGGQTIDSMVTVSSYFSHLVNVIVGMTWNALKIGVLVRGGVTVGRLHHSSRVIAGKAFVDAFQLEKKAKYPRIEIDPVLTKMKDKLPNSGGDLEYIFDEMIYHEHGRYFLNCLGFHIGVWRDHNYYRQRDRLEPESHSDVLARIVKRLDDEYKIIKRKGDKTIIEKWDWFMDEFQRQTKSGHWPQALGLKK